MAQYGVGEEVASSVREIPSKWLGLATRQLISRLGATMPVRARPMGPLVLGTQLLGSAWHRKHRYDKPCRADGATTLDNNVAQVALGTDHGCAVKTDGTLWCWGLRLHGAIGDGSDETDGCCQTTPVQIGESTLGNDVAEVALGDGHGCALKVDGTIWCWGEAPGMFKYGMFNYKYPVEVPWCGDGVCTFMSATAETARTARLRSAMGYATHSSIVF
ncbi:MAG: hypothetical protein IPM54_21110 [Polyangiaceae bacterium]|nr:hypothetical protein [Polyangiaceae bacterium]